MGGGNSFITDFDTALSGGCFPVGKGAINLPPDAYTFGTLMVIERAGKFLQVYFPLNDKNAEAANKKHGVYIRWWITAYFTEWYRIGPAT